jgi:predicted nucleic acid-binding protein
VNHGIDTGFLVAAEVIEHANHRAARAKIAELATAGDKFAIAPQVLAEFIHVVTDPRRFATPLTMDAARTLAQKWWTASDVIHITPDESAVAQFFEWHRRHDLGRKRILDTLLAATYQSAGINSLLTTDAKDFAMLGGFQCITPQ